MTTRMQLDNTTPAGPVTCLGQTFASDAARREHFTALLREKLKDPAFRSIEGFPHGADEDILALSDPPYYTACPNPWLADFVAEWEAAKPQAQREAPYSREPFAFDVEEGKKDSAILSAHAYHTKVPPKVITHYLLHYTNPGDIVLDVFSGTGMTGVAAKMCGSKQSISEMGYYSDTKDSLYKQNPSIKTQSNSISFSSVGTRKCIISDLSVIASAISYNNNTPVKSGEFTNFAANLLNNQYEEYGWIYKTSHTNGIKYDIDYTVWSDVYLCSECNAELVYFDVAVDYGTKTVHNKFDCPKCSATLQKDKLSKKQQFQWDQIENRAIPRHFQVPVLIHYSVGTTQYKKKPDLDDLALIEKVSLISTDFFTPEFVFIRGDETDRLFDDGIYKASQLYTTRNLLALSALWSQATTRQRLIISSMSENHASIRNRYLLDPHHPVGTTGGPLANTYYIPSLSCEVNVFKIFAKTQKKFIKAFSNTKITDYTLIACSSATNLLLANDSIDFVFIDPPFGANINYSELNFVWESWLKIHTNQNVEAVISKTRKLDSDGYFDLMLRCFSECYRVLKPGRWITVEFSNTKASIWNIIQSSLTQAGFILANVSMLSKQRGGMHSALGPTAVKQDLAISAYNRLLNLKPVSFNKQTLSKASGNSSATISVTYPW